MNRIADLLQDSSKVDRNLGHGSALARDVRAEFTTTFEIDEDGTITQSSSSFDSAHSSLYGPQVSKLQTPLPITIDLQKALDNIRVIKRGEPITRIRKMLRAAVDFAMEMTPFSDGHYDKLRRRNPRPQRSYERQEGLF